MPHRARRGAPSHGRGIRRPSRPRPAPQLDAHLGLAALGDQHLVTREEFLDLDRVVGERFRRRIDRREAAADDHHRQAHLQIGDASRPWRRR